MKAKIFALFTFFLITYSLDAQFNMGSEPGEIYFTTTWYGDVNTDTVYIMLITSKDYGQTFSISHVVGIYAFMGNPPYHWIFPDASNDTLYMKYADTLRISYDDGITWQNRNTTSGSIDWISTGSIKGEIFFNDYGGLSFSSDFGNSFSYVNNIIGQQKVGVEEGSLYVRHIEDEFFYIHHSFDYGATFDTFVVPPDVQGGILDGRYPEFTRGALPGEIYFISWHDPTHFKIFRSTDFGESFTQQYEQNPSDYTWCNFYFISGGRSPGEVYYIDLEPWVEGYYYKMIVYYSTDYGVTFNKYVHEMDENWNGIASFEYINKKNLITNYPNPCNDQTTFIIPYVNEYNNPKIDIFNICGQHVKSIPVSSNETKFNTSKISSGTYIYHFRTDNSISPSKKLIITK